MSGYNKVILMGNLTRDPQVRYIPSGTAVADLGLAINRTWTDRQSGQRREEVTFVDVTVWGRQAEVAGEYLSKGRTVLIEGRLQLDTWQDKETGQNRSKLKVVCENMRMVGGRAEGAGQGGGYQRSGPPGPADDFAGPQTEGESFGSAADDSFGDVAPADAPDDEVPF